MHYVESDYLKKNPGIYSGIDTLVTWILAEPFIYDYFEASISKKSAILDIGCGSGLFLDKLKERGFTNLYGADIGNYLRKGATYPFQTININTERIDRPDGSLDVITALQTLEHLENYFLILSEAKRLLRPGGYFIISTPNPFKIGSKLKFLFSGNVVDFDSGNNHLLFLTKDVFAKTYLQDFEIVRSYYSKGRLPFVGRLLSLFMPKRRAKNLLSCMPRSEIWSDKVCYVLRKK